jgi:hypothetical protein
MRIGGKGTGYLRWDLQAFNLFVPATGDDMRSLRVFRGVAASA